MTEAHINPNSPQIPEIQVKRFSLCGKVEIVNLPPGILQVWLFIRTIQCVFCLNVCYYYTPVFLLGISLQTVGLNRAHKLIPKLQSTNNYISIYKILFKARDTYVVQK